MNKMKRTVKKNKGLELRIAREKFLQELKSPSPKPDPESAQEILQKIRDRNSRIAKRKSPYNAGSNSVMGTLRKMAGLA